MTLQSHSCAYIKKKKKNLVQKHICTPIFISALFTIAKTWKKLKRPLIEQWIKKMGCCCCFSVTQSCSILCVPMDWSIPGFPVLHYLFKFMSTESVVLSNNVILCFPLLLLFSVFPSIKVFSKELVLCIRWPKYWSFRFSISSPNEYLDWFHLGLTDLIFLLSKWLSRVFSSTTIQKKMYYMNITQLLKRIK